MAEAVPAGNVVAFFFIRHGPLLPQRKAGGPSAPRRQQARWLSATGRPLLLAARRAPPLPAVGGQSAGPGGPGGDPLDPRSAGRRWVAEAVPAGNVVVFFFIRHGTLFPQRKAGGPSAPRRQQARWPSATGRPLLLAARRAPPCPPQRAGSPPVQGVQGVTPWTPAPPGGGGGQRPFPRAMLSLFFFTRHGTLFPQHKAGGPSALRRQQARWPSATGRPLLLAARRAPPCPPQRAGGPPQSGGDPLDPRSAGRRWVAEAVPAGMGGCFPVLATAPFYRSVKPEGLPPSGGNKPGGLPPPGVLYCLQPAAHPPCPPQRAGSPPVQGVTPWPPWRGRGRFLRLRRSRTCPLAGSAQSGSRHW